MAVEQLWKGDLAKATAANRVRSAQSTVGSGGGGTQPPIMELELALLKQRADHADQRMERVEQKLDRVVDKLDVLGGRLNGLATKTTVWSALGTGAALSFAVVGLFVAVLAYLQDQRIALRPEPAAAVAAPAPTIIQLPPWPTAPVPPRPADGPPG